jgi:hypothetical protein
MTDQDSEDLIAAWAGQPVMVGRFIKNNPAGAELVDLDDFVFDYDPSADEPFIVEGK